jgi:hypothetical protein
LTGEIHITKDTLEHAVTLVIETLEFYDQILKFRDQSLNLKNPEIKMAINPTTLKVVHEYMPRG